MTQFSSLLIYPFGNIPRVEVSVSLHYDNDWERIVVVTWQEEDGLGLDYSQMPQQFQEEHLKAKTTVEEMRGIYAYKAVKGQGSTTTIQYPHLDLTEMGGKFKSETLLKVLVVDDEQASLEVICDYCERQGFLTLEARDGLSAVEVFLRDRPKIVILDAQMSASSIDAVETIKRIRTIDTQTCFIMTSHFEHDMLSVYQARDNGALGYIVKPFHAERFNDFMLEAKGFVGLCQEVKKWSRIKA